MTKNVLYLSYDGMTDPLGQSQVIPYLIGLSQAGYQITLISCEKKARYDNRHEHIQKILASASINWQPLFYHKSPPVFSTVYDLWSIYRKAVKLHKQYHFELVHCRSYPSSLLGLILKRKKNIPFVFDMRGFWADERVEGKLWNLDNPLYKWIYNFFKSKEKEFVSKSSHIISLTNAGKAEIESWDAYKQHHVPITIIPCSCDFELYKKTTDDKIAEVKEELKIDADSFVLSYIGSLGTWYMLEEMLDFFKLLLLKEKKAVFLILTPDEAEEVYEKAAARGLNKNLFRVLYSTKEKLAAYASISNYSIFFLLPRYSKKGNSPTKLGELLAMKIPVVTNSGVGDVSEIMNSLNVGIIVDHFTNEAYLTAINKMENLHFDMDTARTKAMNIYGLDNAIRSYVAAYHSILDQKK